LKFHFLAIQYTQSIIKKGETQIGLPVREPNSVSNQVRFFGQSGELQETLITESEKISKKLV
jgi:hypothetical protein